MVTKKLDDSWRDQSVSSGTHLQEDLIPAFEGVLEQCGVTLERPAAVTKLLEADDELTDAEFEEVNWYLNEDLFNALDEIAPEGCYFGAHPGDGADFGFWSCEDDEDQDSDDEPQEPEEGDWVTEDHITFRVVGERRTMIVPDGEDWRAALRERMEAEKYFPNAWFISDHGNAHLLDLNA